MAQPSQQEILARWLTEHKGLLLRAVRAYAFSPADRDDLLQEVATALWRSIPAFEERSKVTTWIYRIAVFTAIDWSRGERKHRQGRQGLEVVHANEVGSVTEDRRPDGRIGWLHQQIQRLEPIDRAVAFLLLEGLTYREIANLLGISETNVGVKVHRIKKRLEREQRKESR